MGLNSRNQTQKQQPFVQTAQNAPVLSAGEVAIYPRDVGGGILEYFMLTSTGETQITPTSGGVPGQVSAGEITAGSEVNTRLWSPADVVSAISQHETGEVNPDDVSAGEITAGTETANRSYSPVEIVSFITQHSPGGVTDHGALSGLGDDDHTQYLTETRHDALSADNPHSVTLTQAVSADSNTDITSTELETLSNGSNADFLHTHAGSGEANTSSNSGSGQGLALAKTGVNLPFKSLTAATGLSYSSTATEIAIALAINALSDEGTVDGANDRLLMYDASTSSHKKIAPNSLPTGGGGEVNTGGNVGGGTGLFKDKTGLTLNFKTLVAGTNMSFAVAADTVTLNAAGGGSSAKANILLPAGASIAARIGSATGLPAGWTLYEGNHANVDPLIAGAATDLVIDFTPDTGMPIIHVFSDFASLFFQFSLAFQTVAGDIVTNNGQTQIKIKDVQGKLAGAAAKFVMTMV